MKNLLAVCLVVMTSLVATSVFSATPAGKEHARTSSAKVDGKPGHRMVVVEFQKVDDDDHGNTKVSISPPEEDHKLRKEDSNGVSSSTQQQQQEEEDTVDQHDNKWSGPAEVVFDAFDKCKHRIASAIGRTKEAVSGVEEEKSSAIERAKDAASRVSSKVKQGAKKSAEKVKHGAENVVDTTKTLRDESKRNGSRKIEAIKGKISDKAKEAKEMVEHVTEKIKEAGGKTSFFFTDALPQIMAWLHLLGFATSYGMFIWVTLASSYVLAGALPSQQYAILQREIYPVYFNAMACSLGIALIGYLMSQGTNWFQSIYLLATLLMIMLNLFYLEPRSTKVLSERMKKEKEETKEKEGIAPEPSNTFISPHDATQASILNETLKCLNSCSSFLNVVSLMFLTCHLVHLGHRLNTVC